MTQYLCKQFDGDKWIILGSVFANDISEAWTKAHQRWDKVDNVWEYGDSIQWMA